MNVVEMEENKRLNTAGILPREIKMYFIRNNDYDKNKFNETKCNEVAVFFFFCWGRL